MAHHKAALKSIRQDKKRRARNRYFKKTMRTFIKKVRNAVKEGKIEEATSLLPKTYSIIDKCAVKKIIHKNTAARYKSRLMAFVNKAKNGDLKE